MAAHPAPGEDEDNGLADLGHMFEDENGWQGPRVGAESAQPATEPAGVESATAERAGEQQAGEQQAGEQQPAAAAPARSRGTAADLRLLRSNTALRARAIAAVVLPFVLYVVVMIVIGRTDRILLFLWAPILVAGVLFGAVLDVGHRSSGRA